jgi:three-Cys-motif partner protein
MTRRRKDYLIATPDDGLVAPPVGPWAAEKYRRVGMYAEIFSTGMKNRWPRRAYVDLFSGPGHAQFKDSSRRILTSPLLALSVPDPFTKYVFCDRNASYIEALRVRAHGLAPSLETAYVLGDVNRIAPQVSAEIPDGFLTFCFVDPFGIDIQFDTIRRLSTGRAIDFLILLALAMDATRNWNAYVAPDNPRIDGFLGNVNWRERWQQAELARQSPIRFLATEYAREMGAMGYLTSSIDQMIEVRTHDNNMRLYYLAFFSKNKRGYDLWREVQKYSTDQLGLL